MLHKLQTSFLQGIYDAGTENNAYPFIQETADKTAAQQLSIYRQSIFGGLKKALAETYPVTKELVGEEFFNMMLGQYIKTYPCKVQDLNDYGEELAGFIQDLKQARSVPYLADIARLEWFYNIALNAEVQKNNLYQINQLSAEQQLQLTLALPNGSALMRSVYPIDEIYSIHWDDRDMDVEYTDKDVFLIIWKNQSKVNIDVLTEEQFYFLGYIENQDRFVNVCKLTINTGIAVDINMLFTDSIHNGWIQSYSLNK